MVDKRVIDTVLAEAEGEGLDGMIAVAFVMANRADKSGKSLLQVVKAPGQFSGYSNPGKGVNLNSPRLRQMAEQAINSAVNGTVPDPTGGATHYWSPKGMKGGKDPYWADDEQTKYGRLKIGNHVFLPRKAVSDTALAAIDSVSPQDRPTGLGYAQQPGATGLLSGAVAPAAQQSTGLLSGQPLPRYAGDSARGNIGAGDSLALNPGPTGPFPAFNADLGINRTHGLDVALDRGYAMQEVPEPFANSGMTKQETLAPGWSIDPKAQDPFAMPPQRLPELPPLDFASYFPDPRPRAMGDVARGNAGTSYPTQLVGGDPNSLAGFDLSQYGIDRNSYPADPATGTMLEDPSRQSFRADMYGATLGAPPTLANAEPDARQSFRADMLEKLRGAQPPVDPAYAVPGNPFAPVGVPQGKDLTRLASGNETPGQWPSQLAGPSLAPIPMPFDMGRTAQNNAALTGMGGVDIDPPPQFKTPDPFPSGDAWKVGSSTDGYGRPVTLTPGVTAPVSAASGYATPQQDKGMGGIFDMISQIFGGGDHPGSTPGSTYSGGHSDPYSPRTNSSGQPYNTHFGSQGEAYNPTGRTIYTPGNEKKYGDTFEERQKHMDSILSRFGGHG